MVQSQPFPFGVDRSRLVWDNIIQRYGDLAVLRQPSLPDRWVSGIVGQFSAIERLGGISNPADRKAIVSTISPDTGLELTPDPSERDVYVTLVLDDNGAPILDVHGNLQEIERLKIVAPPTPIGTSQRQLYWKLQIRK